jgi:cytochrome c biogenesis protein CcmG, thiol:disulfide interchange protein DsbE
MRAEAGTARRIRPSRVAAMIAVLAFVGLLVYGLSTKGSSARIDNALSEGTAPLAPSFDLPVLERGTLPTPLGHRLRGPFASGSLSPEKLAGTPFVLNFWASWCDPCRQEAPILEAGWRRLGPKDVLFLGLNMQDNTGDARHFLDEFGVSYPTIRDQTSDTSHDFGATGIPETYFVSADGHVVGHVIGVVTPEDLDSGAAAALNGKVVGTEEGGARKPQR